MFLFAASLLSAQLCSQWTSASTFWKQFGTNFGTILGTKVGHQSMIDSVRNRIYAKSIFERHHPCFEWFLLSRGLRNSIKFHIKSVLKSFVLSDCVWKPIWFDFKAVWTRFWTDFCSKIAGPNLEELVLEAVPTLKWIPKGRLDPT